MYSRLLFFSFFFTIFLLPTVLAHAVPTSILPAEEIHLQSPETLTIEFSERIEGTSSGITLVESDGRTRHLETTIPTPNSIEARITGVKNGSLFLTWYALSRDDGHFTTGTIRYLIGPGEMRASNGPATTVNFSRHTPEAILIFIEHLCISLILVFAIVSILTPPGAPTPGTDHALFRWAPLVSGIAFASTLFSFALLVSEAPIITSASWAERSITVGSSTVGIEAITRCILLLILIILVFMHQKNKTTIRPKTAYLILVLCAGIGMCRAALSHAAASPMMPTLSIVIAGLHLLSKELWTGIAIGFAFIALNTGPTTGIKKSWTMQSIASTSFAVMILTGGYLVLVDLKDFSNVITTPWGFGLMLTTPILMIGLLLRTINAHQTTHHEEKTPPLKKSLDNLEAIIAIIFLVASSFMMVTSPPLFPPTILGQIESDGVVIAVVADDHPFPILTLTDTKGNPLDLQSTTVTLDDPTRGIATLVIHTIPDGIGRARLHIDAQEHGTLDITGHRRNAYDATGIIQLSGSYPDRHRFTPWFIGAIGVLTMLTASIALWPVFHQSGHH